MTKVKPIDIQNFVDIKFKKLPVHKAVTEKDLQKQKNVLSLSFVNIR